MALASHLRTPVLRTLWTYDHRILDLSGVRAWEKTVDLLSLWLSLRDQRDDRIQMALDALEEEFS